MEDIQRPLPQIWIWSNVSQAFSRRIPGVGRPDRHRLHWVGIVVLAVLNIAHVLLLAGLAAVPWCCPQACIDAEEAFRLCRRPLACADFLDASPIGAGFAKLSVAISLNR